MDLTLLLPLVLIAVLVVLMFRRSRQQQKTMAEMQTKMEPGVEVMTSFGLFGRIVSVNDAENQVVLELSPGNTATVHRQAVTKVIESVGVEAASPVVPDDVSSLTGPAAESPPERIVPQTSDQAQTPAKARSAENPEEAPKPLDEEKRGGGQ